MLKDLFMLAISTLRPALDWMLPFYPYYIIAVFLGVTAYLAFTALSSAAKDLRQAPAKYLTWNMAFLAGLFLLLWLSHRSFIIFSDEKLQLQQALEYARTGNPGLLLSDSIMPLFFAAVLKLGGLTAVKTVIFLLLAVHFLLWKLVLEDVFKAGTLLSAAVIFLCAGFCMACFPDIVSYMSFGYVLSSLAAYLALKHCAETAGSGIYYLLPAIALLAIVFRQECVVLLPFLFLFLLFSGAVKKRIWPLLLACVLALPMLYSLWQDETGMNAEPFDRALVAACAASGRPMQECYTPGISANRSYMLNTLMLLSGLDNVRKEEIVDLAEETYNAPNPSLRNVYYNLAYRELWLKLVTGAAFACLLLGVFFLKPLRRRLGLLACLTALYFAIFYLQKYSVGDFQRFYFYLFPFYCCFFAVLLDAAIKRYRSRGFAGRTCAAGGGR